MPTVKVPNAVNSGIRGAANLGQGAYSKSKGFFNDFTDFLNRGHAFDLAVAFVLSAALSAVIKSLVDDIITPVFGLGNNRNLDEMFLVIRCGTTCNYTTRAAAQSDGAVTWNWGHFLNTCIYFVLVGLFLFIMVKLYYVLRRKTLVKDKVCDYCAKEIPGVAVRCAFCSTWLDHDVRRKIESDFFNPELNRSMSTTTLGTSNGLLRDAEKSGAGAAGVGTAMGAASQAQNQSGVDTYQNVYGSTQQEQWPAQQAGMNNYVGSGDEIQEDSREGTRSTRV